MVDFFEHSDPVTPIVRWSHLNTRRYKWQGRQFEESRQASFARVFQGLSTRKGRVTLLSSEMMQLVWGAHWCGAAKLCDFDSSYFQHADDKHTDHKQW